MVWICRLRHTPGRPYIFLWTLLFGEMRYIALRGLNLFFEMFTRNATILIHCVRESVDFECDFECIECKYFFHSSMYHRKWSPSGYFTIRLLRSLITLDKCYNSSNNCYKIKNTYRSSTSPSVDTLAPTNTDIDTDVCLMLRRVLSLSDSYAPLSLRRRREHRILCTTPCNLR